MAILNCDVLDEVCMAMKGHTNWGYLDSMKPDERRRATKNNATVVVFWNEPGEDEEEQE